MAMTAEQRKIKRLEKTVADLKLELTESKEKFRRLDRELMYERQWRMDFQKLLKAATFDDNLEDYQREYW